MRIRRIAAPIMTVVAAIAAATSAQAGMPVLDALAMIETGATKATVCKADYKVGRAGEVSRYQVKPSVWRKYSKCRTYHNPTEAKRVTKAIMSDRVKRFVVLKSRPPTTNELYILWNAPGQILEGRGVPSRVVKERAQRFANLVHH